MVLKFLSRSLTVRVFALTAFLSSIGRFYEPAWLIVRFYPDC